ncbi:Fe(3+) ABC transporter substrate-binding protein [Chromatocurvus halotolerans]|uniref:Iron(III) transport system substrate-binding protein n=1 Tax=Chromatocurvus halotolerans TaxID=1132028 RepID=A0A4R2KYW1_9GAMM|nr:Fe(3+) ABC transporter substrate-binding protein [Chromatocurvus halotolerans]TCO78352.1 iron(III) transport system substrate-binding protein [Chromatocurvus halotolerans]
MLTTHSPRRPGTRLTVLFAAAVTTAVLSAGTVAETLNIYSARQEALIKPLLDRFSDETGVEVNLVTGSGDALITRLTTEGRNSPADVLLTSDAGRLYRARQAGVLQPVSSDVLTAAIPANLRSPDNLWYGLSVRARVLIIAPDRVNTDELQDYEDLADPQWKGRICVRSSGNIYNQSLVAGMLAQQDSAQTQAWLDGFVRNFARPPQGGDRDQIKAVAAGQCDVALVNSYYLGAMLQSDNDEERQAAEQVELLWPNQSNRGAHINISGAGVTRASEQPDLARQLIEFLVREDSQRWYAETNNEYPVRDGVPHSRLLQAWGDFKADALDVSELGRLNAQAVMAMDRANWK